MGKQEKEMSTAVTSTPAGDGKSGPLQPATAGALTAHRPGEGYATRLGMMLVCVAYVLFACHHFFYGWIFIREIFDKMFGAIGLGVLTNWSKDPAWAKKIGWGGTFMVALIGFYTAYYYIYVKRRTAEFLIKVDGELTKVTWPQITPWFRADTKVWGATYVVLIVVAAMTLYVFVIDVVLKFLSSWAFYNT